MKLTLFFTKDMSLKAWDRQGILERESALYLRLRENGVHTSFITYGGPEDLTYAPRIPGIAIYCNKWNLSRRLYERLIPIIHILPLIQSHCLKTNQMKGALTALRSAALWKKPLVARCGYMWSELEESIRPDHTEEFAGICALEHRVFTAADRVIVTALRHKNYIMHRYDINAGKIHIIPNYVLTDRFAPVTESPSTEPNRLCFVGRLSEEKNLHSLIAACSGLDVSLAIVGKGRLRKELEEHTQRLSVRASFYGAVAHFDIPAILKASSVFLLVSHSEGHPKALIEAMSLGMPVIGADVAGIRDIISHGENGWLCKTDPESIRTAIITLLQNEHLREKLGIAAKKYALSRYSLGQIADKEYTLYRKLTGRRNHG